MSDEPWKAGLTPQQAARARQTLTMLNPCHGGQGCTNQAAAPHACPYQDELQAEGAADDYCTCCDDCAAGCAADI